MVIDEELNELRVRLIAVGRKGKGGDRLS